MTYRAEFEGAALVQLNGLPLAAFDALVERTVASVTLCDEECQTERAEPP